MHVLNKFHDIISGLQINVEKKRLSKLRRGETVGQLYAEI